MPGLVPGIHVCLSQVHDVNVLKNVDGRDEPGHDDPSVIGLVPYQ